jgi:hypothetical protein
MPFCRPIVIIGLIKIIRPQVIRFAATKNPLLKKCFADTKSWNSRQSTPDPPLNSIFSESIPLALDATIFL